MTVLTTYPGVLRWAREIRGVTVEDAAAGLGWTVDYLDRVENGGVDLDQETLSKIAKLYKLPMATLLMPAPLDRQRYGPRPLTDYRLHPGGIESLGVETQRFIEDAWELLELMVEIGATIDLPRYTLDDNEAEVAARERARIGFSIAEQLGWDNERTAYIKWRVRLEEEGIIVNSLNIKEEDVRGLAIYREGACLIAVNKNEPHDRSKVYSVLHEYAHLLLRESGFSDENRRVPVERWCNQFAAHFLLPEADVLRWMREQRLLGRDMTGWHINRVSSAFKVSRASVAIRFEEIGLAPAGFYEQWKAEQGAPKKRKGGFDPNRDQVQVELNRYGTRHVSVVLEALARGEIDPVEARYALDVNPDYHERILNAARERQEAYGRRRAG